MPKKSIKETAVEFVSKHKPKYKMGTKAYFYDTQMQLKVNEFIIIGVSVYEYVTKGCTYVYNMNNSMRVIDEKQIFTDKQKALDSLTEYCLKVASLGLKHKSKAEYSKSEIYNAIQALYDLGYDIEIKLVKKGE